MFAIHMLILLPDLFYISAATIVAARYQMGSRLSELTRGPWANTTLADVFAASIARHLVRFLVFYAT